MQFPLVCELLSEKRKTPDPDDTYVQIQLEISLQCLAAAFGSHGEELINDGAAEVSQHEKILHDSLFTVLHRDRFLLQAARAG